MSSDKNDTMDMLESGERQQRSDSVTQRLRTDSYVLRTAGATSRQPTFPSEYAEREGNAGMVAITGFVMATMTSSLLDIFTPEASQESIWLYFACFGGFLQIYAGVKDFHHGNTLTACIFFLFGFHWVSKGFLMGNLLFLQNVENPDHVPNDAIMGVYYMVFMMFTALLTFCTYLSPHGSWLLVVILGIVVVKLALASIDSWTPHRELVITGGVLGVVVCLLAVYSFIADSLAEHGVVIATGKFGGTKTRPQVKKENAGHDE